MVFGLFRRREDRAHALYAACVAQARRAALYEELAVPDTVDGRFEAIVLHTGLVVARLTAGSPQARDAGRQLSEVFFTDMDRSLREMGVGDLSVPKKMTKVAQAFYGRLNAYQGGLAAAAATATADAAPAGQAEPEGLAIVLARNVYDGRAPEGAAGALAAYVRDLAAVLAASSDDAVLAARIAFPDPAAFAPEPRR